MKPTIISAVGTASAQATVTAHASHIVKLSVQHMLAAARFSRSVQSIEAQNAGQSFGVFWEEIFHHATACIMTATASMEAYANELYFDRSSVFPGHSNALLDSLWAEFDRKPVIKKFEFALLLMNKPVLGGVVVQHFAVLQELRNALIHFKPERSSEAMRHDQLSRRLSGKFVPSAFLNDALLFPRRWATHGCTKWAVETCLSFAMEFEQLSGLSKKFAVADLRALNP